MSQTMIVMTAALGVELVLLLIAALSLAYLRNRAARRRDHAAIKALVGRVRQERPQREQAIAQFLSGQLGYQGSDLSDNATLLARAELKLLHRFALLYRDRDADLAGRFDGELNAMLDAYHALAAAAIAAPATESTEPAVDDAELEFLRRENTRLSDELRITMETMSRMLNEYSTMFAPMAEPEGIEPQEAAFEDPPDAAAGFSDAAAVDVEAEAEAAAPANQADEGDWEVAVDAAGQGSGGDEGDWEVAVDVADPLENAGQDDWEVAADSGVAAALADEADAEEIASEPADPLEEIMRAAANQERSARGATEAADALDAPAADKAATQRPAPDVDEDVDLFDVVVEGTPTTKRADTEPALDLAEDAGDDLFDVVEAPRSRSAS